MKPHNTYVEKFRDKKAERRIYGQNGNSGNGIFWIPRDGYRLAVILSDGGGWDHASVTRDDDQTPTWDDMAEVKRLFFRDDETVVQFHPKKSEYINHHPGCLHLWRKQGQEYELPPSIYVGPKS
jgi:hypothetical protein